MEKCRGWGCLTFGKEIKRVDYSNGEIRNQMSVVDVANEIHDMQVSIVKTINEKFDTGHDRRVAATTLAFTLLQSCIAGEDGEAQEFWCAKWRGIIESGTFMETHR